MRRRSYVAGLGSVLTAGLAGCSALGSSDDDDDGDADGAFTNGSFEDDLAGWTVGKDLPAPPGEDSGTVDHGVTTVEERASDGESSVQLYVSGVADDGTIWVEQQVDFTDVTAVEVDAYSRQQSFNRIAMLAVFAGEKPADGLAEGDFDTDEHIEDHEGWKTYSYDVSAVTGTGTLAVGMTVIWETEVRRLLDDVRLVSE